MSMSEHTEIKTYSGKDTEGIITYSQKHTEEINKHDHVGLWVITSSFRIRVRTKPNWFHRLMARLLLGWKWEDRR